MTMQSTNNTAPELAVTRWFNTPDNPTLADFRGEVVVIETFQMLCPGCVSHGLPQAKRIQQNFGDDVTLLGLHTVFEHHDAMTPVSLEAFLHEYRITFPVGVDAPAPGATTPITMGRYRLRGTPSLVVIDRAGRIRLNARLAISKTSPSALASPALSTNPAPIRTPTATPTSDQLSRHWNPTTCQRRIRPPRMKNAGLWGQLECPPRRPLP